MPPCTAAFHAGAPSSALSRQRQHGGRDFMYVNLDEAVLSKSAGNTKPCQQQQPPANGSVMCVCVLRVCHTWACTPPLPPEPAVPFRHPCIESNFGIAALPRPASSGHDAPITRHDARAALPRVDQRATCLPPRPQHSSLPKAWPH